MIVVLICISITPTYSVNYTGEAGGAGGRRESCYVLIAYVRSRETQCPASFLKGGGAFIYMALGDVESRRGQDIDYYEQ